MTSKRPLIMIVAIALGSCSGGESGSDTQCRAAPANESEPAGSIRTASGGLSRESFVLLSRARTTPRGTGVDCEIRAG